MTTETYVSILLLGFVGIFNLFTCVCLVCNLDKIEKMLNLLEAKYEVLNTKMLIKTKNGISIYES